MNKKIQIESMKLICIDAITDVLQLGSGSPELTLGKEYEIIRWYDKKEDGRQFIGIINDSNVLTEYLISRFITKKEYRDKQLNKILNEVR